MIISSTDNTTLRYAIFVKIHLSCLDNESYKTYENNYGGISLDVTAKGNPMNWGEVGKKYFKNEKFYCSSDKIPYVFFNSPQDSVNFLVEIWEEKIKSIKFDPEEISRFLFLNQTSETGDLNIYNNLSLTDKSNLQEKVKAAIDKVSGTFK